MNIAKQIRSRALKRKAETDKERLDRKRAEEKWRRIRAETNTITPDGFHPVMRAKLHAAAQRAAEDPRAKKLVDRAILQKRVEQLRRQTSIGNVSPPIFAGEPIEPSLVPPRVADQVKESRVAKAAEQALPKQEFPIIEKKLDRRTKTKNP